VVQTLPLTGADPIVTDQRWSQRTGPHDLPARFNVRNR